MSTKKVEQTVEQKNTVAAEEKAKVALVQQLIYIGPTIKGVVVENTILKNGVPEELEKKMQEVPAMKSLLVKVDDLAKTKVAVNREGSAENMCYKKVLESMKKGE